MMPPKGVIEQLVLVDSPEQVPLKDGDVIGNLFGAQDFQVDVHSLRGAFLLRQLCLYGANCKSLMRTLGERGRSTYQSIQMILDGNKQATVEREASGYANIVILEHGPLPIRFHLDEAQVVGSAIQLQLVGGARFD